MIRIRHMLRKISKSSHINIIRDVSADMYICVRDVVVVARSLDTIEKFWMAVMKLK